MLRGNKTKTERFGHHANLFMISEQEVEVERQRGDKVDDVDRCPNERQLAGTDHKADEYLERKPCVADALDVEESVVRIRAPLVQQPRRCTVRPDGGRRQRYGAAGEMRNRDVLDRRNAHARMRLDTEREN